MKIIFEKTTYFKFAFEFAFDKDIVIFCRFLRDNFGFKSFTYTGSKWRFNDTSIMFLIQERYPEVIIDPQIIIEIGEEEKRLAESKKIEKRAMELKNATDSDIVIEGIKGDLRAYQKVGVEFFMNNKGRGILADGMGCIAGDQEIKINRGGNCRTYAMREAYKRFNDGSWKKWLDSKTRSLTQDGILRLNTIKEIKMTGIKDTIKLDLETDSGKRYSIKLTPDHELITPEKKWVMARELSIGDKILVNGKKVNKLWCPVCEEETERAISDYTRVYRPKNYGKCKRCIYRFVRNNYRVANKSLPDGESYDKSGYILVSDVYFHPVLKSRKNNKSIRKHVLVYEAFLNKVSYENWHGMMKNNKLPNNAKFIDSKTYSVHHKDGNKSNNDIENLELLSIKDHLTKEGKQGGFLNIKEFFVPEEATIKTITKTGEIDVYDIVMDDPDRSFVANGVIVHNSGKSIQSLAYLVKARHERTLVISPASVKFSWKNEVKKWTSLKCFVVDSQTIFSEIPYDTHVIIINYDILKKFKNELLLTKFDACVLDEAHLLKNPTAIRSKIVKLITKNIPSVIFLTGTPLLSRPVELYNILTMVDSKEWNDYYGFCKRYCDGRQGYFGFEAKGATNLEELQERMAKYFLRRTKDQILKELPKKNHIEYVVEHDPETRALYYKASNDFINYLKQNKGKTDKQAAKAAKAEKLVKINLLREINTMGKIPAAKELIDSIIESGEKVLIFSSFNAPLLELHEEYLDSCLILGDTPVEERGEIVRKFQEDPNVRVFFGGYKSAGVGITLTAAQNILLMDYPFNPADREQSIDRANRIGSIGDSLNIYQLYTEGTVDKFMKKLLDRKQKIFDQVIDGKFDKIEEAGSIEEMIKMIEEENNINKFV